MPVYRIRPGQKHYILGKRKGRGRETNLFTAGDEVELETFQAAPFLDKMELVGETEDEKSFRTSKENTVKKSAPRLVEVGDDEYNVINQTTGKPINKSPLSKEDAEKLAAV